MKFRFDLLPQEYKSFPRDTLGIVLAVLAIVSCLSAVGSMYIKNSKEIKAAQILVDKVENDLRALIEKTGKLQPPLNEINALKNSINFINKNLDTPGSSWVDFLTTLESAVPDRVVIKDISPRNFSNLSGTFTLKGEAVTVYDTLEFVNRLLKTGKFEAFLKDNANATGPNGTVQKFTLEFRYIKKK
jgi:hypothetical protein